LLKNRFIYKGLITDQYHWCATIFNEFWGVLKSSTIYKTFIEGRTKNTNIIAGTKDHTVSTSVLSEKVLYLLLEIIIIKIKYRIKTNTLVITTIT